MKSPDRLLASIDVLKSMAKLWVALLFALVLLGMISTPGPYGSHVWQSIKASASIAAQAITALVVILIGGKLLVSLFQIARNDPDRIHRAIPWLFETEDTRRIKQNAASRHRPA